MPEKYAGKIGPADAMSALSAEFADAYSIASKKLLEVVLEFEKTTGRIVDEIALERIDVTQLAAPGRQFIRQASLHFLPKPGEVNW